jgi:DNA-binding MarR family transcriptional regulator
MNLPRTRSGDSATALILATFRANGRLLDAGDRIGAIHGLTSARWQVLGAVALADRPLTVPQIARRMGLARQSVHATVDHLIREGMIELTPNEEHRRSPLVCLTEIGRDTYAAVDREQAGWVNELARGIPRLDLETARAVLEELTSRLEADRPARPGGPRTRARDAKVRS